MEVAKITKRERDSFNAIFSFVTDLFDMFGSKKKATPITLYHRLIENTKMSDVDTIRKVIEGFKTFLTLYNTNILEGSLDKIPKGTKIRYGTNDKIDIYIDIQRFIYKTKDDEDTFSAIRNHLLNISCIIEPDTIKVKELEKLAKMTQNGEIQIDTSTKEGQFVNNLMQKARNNMKNIKSDNPMEAVAGLVQGGVVQDLISGLQKGVMSGEMKMENLMKTMQSAMGAMIPSSEDGDADGNDGENESDGDKADDVENDGDKIEDVD